MNHPLEAALADPWAVLRVALDGPLHPGGEAATEALLDRAGVGPGTRLLDVGCGAGESVALARARGADPVGVDREPAEETVVRGDLAHLPVRDRSVDVVLAECTLCLAPSLSDALGEARRVLRPDGRLALSDVVVEGDLPDLPASLERALCLSEGRGRAALRTAVEESGFALEGVRDHRGDLLAMRDRLAERVDYEGLLAALGDRGRELRDGIADLEAAVENGRVGYASLVAAPAAGGRNGGSRDPTRPGAGVEE